jgi:hypothetical protein
VNAGIRAASIRRRVHGEETLAESERSSCWRLDDFAASVMVCPHGLMQCEFLARAEELYQAYMTFPPGRRRHGRAASYHSIELALKAYQRGEKRCGHQGWYLSRAESIRPRLVITIQPPPRRSIDFTVPAPGMSSPGATSIEPRGLSTTATPA